MTPNVRACFYPIKWEHGHSYKDYENSINLHVNLKRHQ